MTFKTLLIASTVLSSLMLSQVPVLAADNQNTKAEVVVATSEAARQSAMGFVNRVNDARYALVSKDGLNAKKYVEAARLEADKLARLTSAERKITGIQSGRVLFNDDGDSDDSDIEDYYYYPIETGRIATKEVGAGPFWSNQKGLAVKDAELLYVTADLSIVNPQQQLDKAMARINANDLDDAQDILEDLVEDVIVVESSEQALAIKARDNLELTRNYMDAGNYEAARYPLKHAKSALKKMEGNDRYASQQGAVKKYLTDIDRYEKVIESKDPTALEKMKKDWNAMWDDMKKWVDEKTS